jgi:hypothetical protein
MYGASGRALTPLDPDQETGARAAAVAAVVAVDSRSDCRFPPSMSCRSQRSPACTPSLSSTPAASRLATGVSTVTGMFPAAREAVTRLTEADPLAVLPVTAATASAAFARAADPGRDHLERQQQLAVLETSLDSLALLLDRCQQEAARLARALAEESRTVDVCPVPWPVCRHCPGVPLSCSARVWRCQRCGRVNDVPPGSSRCLQPPNVTVRDHTHGEQAMCLSHAAAAVRQVQRLVVVSASRAERAVLAEVAGESSVVARHVPRLADARPRGRGE